MRDFPSCFGESGVQVSDSSSSTSKAAQNLVTCVYQSRLHGGCCLITVTWSKNLIGQGLSVGIEDSANQSLCKVDVKPWLFSKRKGSKAIEANSTKIDIFWDLSSARFGSSPEPLENFYLAIVSDRKMVLLLGDLSREAYKKTNTIPPRSNSVFVLKREHIFGKKVYCTKAQFCDNGRVHDVAIECNVDRRNDPCLSIRVDKKILLLVKRLAWKFRGNQTILVDALPVEVFWDVHDWLFNGSVGNAVFMFQSRLPEAEKFWPGQLSDSSVLSWSSLQIFRETRVRDLGFSLILYAWKNE